MSTAERLRAADKALIQNLNLEAHKEDVIKAQEARDKALNQVHNTFFLAVAQVLEARDEAIVQALKAYEEAVEAVIAQTEKEEAVRP